MLGAGVGGAFNEAQKSEWRNAEVESKTRATRFEEVVEVVRGLTTGRPVSFAGQHFEFEDVRIAPASPQKGGVPFLVAAHWRSGRERQFERVARLGSGVMSISDYPDEYGKVVERIEHHAGLLERDDSLERSFYMTVNIGSDADECASEADRFLKLYYGMNMWGDRWGPYGPSELISDRIRRYKEAGAETMIVRFASFDQERQLSLFLEEVVSQFD